MGETSRHPSAATVIAITALVLAMAGGAYAGAKVTPSVSLAPRSVTAPKLARGAVTTAKIKNGAVTGAKVVEATLGAVPNVAGRIPFFQPLQNGESVVIARNGVVTLNANCAINNAGSDEVSITARTAQDGAVMDGHDDHNGTPTFLNLATTALDSELAYNVTPTGTPNVDNDPDEGFVIGPDGKGFSIDGDEMRLGLNFLSLPCFISGVLTQIG